MRDLGPSPPPDIVAMFSDLKDSLRTIDGKLDTLMYRMDRFQERADKQEGRLTEVESRVSTIEDSHRVLDTRLPEIQKELHLLKAKNEDLEGRSRRNNIRIIGLSESISPRNMEEFIEKLLIDLFGRDCFSSMMVIERAHRSLATKLRPGQPPRPIIARFLNYRDRDRTLLLNRE